MFWDSSAIVPSLLVMARSPELAVLLGSDRRPAIWWSTPVECQSALFRRDRERPLPVDSVERALGRLADLVEDAYVIAPTLALRERAGRLVRARRFHALGHRRAGGDGVDGDAVGPDLQREVAREADDARLGRRVVRGHTHGAAARHYGGHVDDAARALALHQRQHGARA